MLGSSVILSILTFNCMLGVFEMAEVLLEDKRLARPHGVLGEDEELDVLVAALRVHVGHLEVRTLVRHLRLQLVTGVDLQRCETVTFTPFKNFHKTLFR